MVQSDEFEYVSPSLTEGTLAEPTYVSVDWKVNFAEACSELLTYEFMVGTCDPDLRLGLTIVPGAQTVVVFQEL